MVQVCVEGVREKGACGKCKGGGESVWFKGGLVQA